MTDVLPAWNAVERAARDAYGRLVSALAYRFRDIAAAEDALADALRLALERWPIDSVPRAPEAWLTAVAKNQLRQSARHRAVMEDPRAVATLEAMMTALESSGGIATDRRLNLMFVCAHPAIDASLRTPLMLQTVLGLDAQRIGRAFLVPGPTMGQRLVRAKQKIRDAGIPFDPPEPRELPGRLNAVHEGIYAAFAAAWDEAGSDRRAQHDEPLDEEAIFLASLLTELLPAEPESTGLLVLMMFSHARRRARIVDDVFVPLGRQDTGLWDRAAIVAADSLLLRASSMRSPGPFQLEAAIQSAHCQRLFSGATPWTAIVMLHEALDRLAPTVATRVAFAAALVEVGRCAEASALLEGIDHSTVDSHAPYWVVLAHVARATGDASRRRDALDRAIGLMPDGARKRYLMTLSTER